MVDEVGPVGGHLIGVERSALVFEHVLVVVVELGYGRVQRDGNLVTGDEAGRADALHQRLERLLI